MNKGRKKKYNNIPKNAAILQNFITHNSHDKNNFCHIK